MKFDPADITFEVYPSHVLVSYRLPSDTLFKRKYMGYSQRAALAEFKATLRELLQ